MSRHPSLHRAPSLRVAAALAALVLGACNADRFSGPAPLLSTDEPTVTPYPVDYNCELFRELIDNDFAIQTCWSNGEAHEGITADPLAAGGSCACDNGSTNF